MEVQAQTALHNQAFLDYLEQWTQALPVVAMAALVPHPDQAALLSVDVIDGFCKAGPLASPRVGRIVEPIAALFRRAWAHGIRHMLLAQDTHEPEAVEFGAWPPHCVRGSQESETVAELKALPFFDQIQVLPKNSIHSGLHTGLNEWLAQRPQVDTCIVVGDCTDLCTYQLAMHLRLDANARQLQRRVIVPVDGVDTYDLPVAVAQEQGILPHPAELLHQVFLYHLALNGVEIVQSIQ
ncbi:MAG: cysteine hydrolase [Chloroflexi bacterium]|nr:cysteine hydrolase [Chloroflexota bacterium]